MHADDVTTRSSESTARTADGTRWRVLPVIGLLLAVHALLAFDSARRWSVTHDEYWHLPVGFLNATTGHFDHDNLNPPLIRIWAAIPLLFTAKSPADVDKAVDATAIGDLFLAANREQYQRLFLWGRGMMVLLSVVTGLILSLLAWEMFGGWAACLTALLWSVEPTILANAALVTTDSGAVFFFVLCTYVLWRYARHPDWSRAFTLGLCLGLAQLAKYTSLLLYPMVISLWLVYRIGNRSAPWLSAGRQCAQWFVLLAFSVLVLNAGYLFHGSFSPLDSFHFQSQAMNRISEALEPVRTLPVPLPRDYLQGLDRQRKIMEGRHPVYLDGQWSTDGFPHYYLMTLAYKLPHSLQLLVALASLLVIWPGRELRMTRVQLWLLLPVGLLLSVASASGMQLGIRYVLPIVPFLVLFAGQLGRWLRWRVYPVRASLIAILLVASPLALRHHPHNLSYFNEMAGGPVGGHNHLLDSNLDWGQDLIELKQYLDENNIPQISLAYFGTFPPAELGIDYRLPPSRMPEPGWHAVSVNYVQGRPHVLRDADGDFHPVGIDEFGYFRFFEPAVARIGGSIDVFHITRSDVLRWRSAMQGR